ncbi:MAG: hypothetical protein ACFFCS_01560 [Candidatus Hodarchaeota archaeon]
MTSKRVIIAGGGAFGMQAAKYFKENEFIPIFFDPDENCLANVNSVKIQLHELAGRLPLNLESIFIPSSIENSFDSLINMDPQPIYLVPAAPVNVVAKIFVSFLSDNNINHAFSPEIVSRILDCATRKEEYSTSLNKEKGIGIISYAPEGMRCPSSCPGKIDQCPHKGGRVERKPLFENLRECARGVSINLKEIIFESRQLAPGVGGIPWNELVKFHEFKQTLKDEEPRLDIIIGTACNCHGVLNGFTIEP